MLVCPYRNGELQRDDAVVAAEEDVSPFAPELILLELASAPTGVAMDAPPDAVPEPPALEPLPPEGLEDLATPPTLDKPPQEGSPEEAIRSSIKFSTAGFSAPSFTSCSSHAQRSSQKPNAS